MAKTWPNPLNFMPKAATALAAFSLTCLTSAPLARANSPETPVASASPETVTMWCTHLSKELMSVNLQKCLNYPWKIDAYSSQGRPIPYMRWTSKAGKTARRILVLGAIHGDEISAVSLVFRWIDFLDRSPADSYLRENDYLFYPLVNPDGFTIKPRTRTNAAGVDLNRNFETKNWDKDALVYWKRRASADKRRYPGTKAGSEVETQAVQKAVDTYKPELIVSVHAPYKVVDHDGPITFPKGGSPLPVRTLGAFPGSLGMYAGLERKTPVVTPELPSATTLPDLKAVEQLFTFIMKSKY